MMLELIINQRRKTIFYLTNMILDKIKLENKIKIYY